MSATDFVSALEGQLSTPLAKSKKGLKFKERQFELQISKEFPSLSRLICYKDNTKESILLEWQLLHLTVITDVPSNTTSGITKLDKGEKGFLLSSNLNASFLFPVKGEATIVDNWLTRLREEAEVIIQSHSSQILNHHVFECMADKSTVKELHAAFSKSKLPIQFNNIINAMRIGSFMYRYDIFPASQGYSKTSRSTPADPPIPLSVYDDTMHEELYPVDDVDEELVQIQNSLSGHPDANYHRVVLQCSATIGDGLETDVHDVRTGMLEEKVEEFTAYRGHVDTYCNEKFEEHKLQLADYDVAQVEARGGDPTATLCSRTPGFLFYACRDPHYQPSAFVQYCNELRVSTLDTISGHNLTTVHDCDVSELLNAQAIVEAAGKAGVSSNDKYGWVCWSSVPPIEITNPYNVEAYSFSHIKHLEVGKKQDPVFATPLSHTSIDGHCLSLVFGERKADTAKTSSDPALYIESPNVKLCALWVLGLQEHSNNTRKAKSIMKAFKAERKQAESQFGITALAEDMLMTADEEEVVAVDSSIWLPHNTILAENGWLYFDASQDAIELVHDIKDDDMLTFPFVRIGYLHKNTPLPFTGETNQVLHAVTPDSPVLHKQLGDNNLILASDGYLYSLYTHERFGIDICGSVINLNHHYQRVLSMKLSGIHHLPIVGSYRSAAMRLTYELPLLCRGYVDEAIHMRAFTSIVSLRNNDESEVVVTHQPDYVEHIPEAITKGDALELSSFYATYFEMIRTVAMATVGLPLAPNEYLDQTQIQELQESNMMNEESIHGAVNINDEEDVDLDDDLNSGDDIPTQHQSSNPPVDESANLSSLNLSGIDTFEVAKPDDANDLLNSDLGDLFEDEANDVNVSVVAPLPAEEKKKKKKGKKGGAAVDSEVASAPAITSTYIQPIMFDVPLGEDDRVDADAAQSHSLGDEFDVVSQQDVAFQTQNRDDVPKLDFSTISTINEGDEGKGAQSVRGDSVAGAVAVAIVAAVAVAAETDAKAEEEAAAAQIKADEEAAAAQIKADEEAAAAAAAAEVEAKASEEARIQALEDERLRIEQETATVMAALAAVEEEERIKAEQEAAAKTEAETQAKLDAMLTSDETAKSMAEAGQTETTTVEKGDDNITPEPVSETKTEDTTAPVEGKVKVEIDEDENLTEKEKQERGECRMCGGDDGCTIM